MITTIKTYLRAAAGLAVAALAATAWYFKASAERAREKATKATQRAKGEKAAREHIQDTTEVTRETEDEIRRSDAESRRDQLRDYASGPRD